MTTNFSVGIVFMKAQVSAKFHCPASTVTLFSEDGKGRIRSCLVIESQKRLAASGRTIGYNNPCYVKVGANEETLLQKHFELMLLTMLYGCANGKAASLFCFRDANSVSSRYVAWVRKRGNIRETFKVSVSSVFPK